MEEIKKDTPITETPKTTENMLEEAKLYAQQLKDEREKIEAIRNEMREIEAKRILGGRTYAGQAEQPVETLDEKWAREAKIRYAGTGMDPTPKK